MKHAKRSAKLYKHSPYDLSDAMVLFVFVLLVVAIIFFYDDANLEPQKRPIQKEQELLLSKLVVELERQNGNALVVGDVVDTTILNRLTQTNYGRLKTILGVDSEFVIYFEDQDGNLIQLGNRPCIGSAYAFVNGRKCSE